MQHGFGVRGAMPVEPERAPWEARYRRASERAAEEALRAEDAAYRARGASLGRMLGIFGPTGRRRWFFTAVAATMAQGLLLGLFETVTGRHGLFTHPQTLQAYFEASSGTLNPYEPGVPKVLLPTFLTYFWIQVATQPLIALAFAKRMRQTAVGFWPGLLIYVVAAMIYFTMPAFADHSSLANLIPLSLLIWGALQLPRAKRQPGILH
jgi:hypothetical protein